MRYVFTCPHSDCWAELEPGDGLDFWCPAEQLTIRVEMVTGDDAWGTV